MRFPHNLSTGKTAFLLFFCLLILYSSLLSSSYFLEGLKFAKAIEDGETSSLYFFHPHHLIYGPVGYICYKTAVLVGYTGRAVGILQVISAILGALGVSLFFTVLRRMRVRHFIALVFSLFLAFSYGYWYHSVNAESNIPALTLLIAAFYLLLRSRDHLFRSLLCGVLHGGSVLFHQAHMLFVVPASLFFLLNDRKRMAVWYFCGLVLSLCIPYVIVGKAVGKLKSLSEFLHWVTLYLHSESSYLQVRASGVVSAVKDIGISFFGGHYLFLDDYRTALYIGAACVVSLFLLVSLFRAVMSWKKLRSGAVHTAVLISVVYGGFHLFWDHYSFWMVQFVSIFFVLALLWNEAKRKSSLILVAFLGIYFGLNLFGNIIPKHLSPPQYVQFIHDLRENTREDDLFLILGLLKLDSRGVGYVDANIPYSLDRTYLTLPDIAQDPEKALEKIENRISRGYDVYLWWDFTPESVRELDPCFAAAANRVFSAYNSVPAFKKGEFVVMRLVPAE